MHNYEEVCDGRLCIYIIILYLMNICAFMYKLHIISVHTGTKCLHACVCLHGCVYACLQAKEKEEINKFEFECLTHSMLVIKITRTIKSSERVSEVT